MNVIERDNAVAKLKNLSYNLRNSICPKLQEIIDSIDRTTNLVKDSYLINGESADKGKIKKISKNVENMKEHIQHKVIPSINAKIDELNRMTFG